MKFFRFLIVYILVQSIFFTSVAQASSILGGWSVTGRVLQGASTVINATKTVVLNGASVVKTSSAVITPNAAQVAKVLARGAAGYALSIAVEQLLGSVDWILDPENNQIKYRPESTNNCLYLYKYNGKDYCPNQLAAAANKYYKDMGIENPNCNAVITNVGGPADIECSGLGGKVGSADSRLNPDYVEGDDQYTQTLPLETVAQRVIDNAESGDSDAKAGTSAAADEALANDPATQANARQQLDTNAKANTDENVSGDAKPKDPTAPSTGSDIALKFPVFCSWAPTVCEAAQMVITFPQTLTNWWDASTKAITDSWSWTKEQYQAVTKSVTDFFKEEPNNDTELDIPEPEMPEIDTDLKFGGQCPDDRVAQIPFVLRTIEMKFSYQPVCQVVSDAKPVLIFVGFFIAALIVGGIKQ